MSEAANGAVTVRVRISAAIDNEYANRAPDFLPLDKLDIGVCELTLAEAREVLADAEFNADIKGGPEEMPGGTRRAYAALVKQLCKAIAAAEVKASSKEKPTVTQVRAAGPDHQVVTVVGGRGTYRRQPCSDCPWRVDAVDEFPAEAFRHSAGVAYDMSQHTFACHQSGQKRPAVCAGFLLRGGAHNLAVRLGYRSGRFGDDVTDGGVELHESYRAMAIANGVDPSDPVLAPCRD
ncbi:MAG: hypothetical protein GAK28_04320 [Luteibacter sp.]|nr:MAG: hypothetical protein GAK28_04320 [Luteibacter sp.]